MDILHRLEFQVKTWPRGYKLVYILKVKINRNDWLLADTCCKATATNKKCLEQKLLLIHKLPRCAVGWSLSPVIGTFPTHTHSYFEL